MVAAEGTVIGAVVALAVGTSMETGKGRGLKAELDFGTRGRVVLVYMGAFVK